MMSTAASADKSHAFGMTEGITKKAFRE